MADDEHNLETIRTTVQSKLAQNDFTGAQLAYQTALLTWVDEARELDADDPDFSPLTEAITSLWMEYAELYVRAKKCFSL